MQIKEFRKDENYMVVPRIRDRVIFEHFTFTNNSHKNGTMSSSIDGLNTTRTRMP